MPTRFKYISRHISTGKRFEMEADFESETDFLRHLNDWNRSGSGNWQFCSVDLIIPRIPSKNQSQGIRLPDQHATELDRLVATGIWSKDGVNRPDAELDELMGDEPQAGC